VFLASENFYETIGCHLSGWNVLNPDDLVVNGFANEMVTKIDVFGTSVRCGIFGDGPLIVRNEICKIFFRSINSTSEKNQTRYGDGDAGGVGGF